jgi:YegS/Rv2252/BmrU family lipid kinase
MGQLIRIIVNPISGQGLNHRLAPDLVRHLTLRGFSPEVLATEGPGHARVLAAAAPEDARCVVSIGGDGTHREVVSGLIGRPVPLCVVPFGTENVLARTFGLHSTLADVLGRIQAGTWRAVDVGLANGQVFMMFAGIGLDAAVTQAVHAARRGPIQRDVYYGASARLWWRYGFPALAVTVDGRPLADDAGHVLVANTPLYADRMRIAPQAVGDDGLLDVVCYRTRSRLQILKLYVQTRCGRHLGHPQVVTARGRRIEVGCAERSAPVQIDGDPLLATPLVCTVRPQAVRLLVNLKSQI